MLTLPDINPFPTDLAEIGQVRKSAQPPVNIREVPPSMLPTEELRFAVHGEKGEGLVREMTSSAGVCEHLLPRNNPALVNKVLPVLKRMVYNVKHQATDCPFEPYPMNAWSTYCDPERFDKEVQRLRTAFLIAGSSADIDKAGDYSRVLMNGRSVLMVRSNDQSLQAFENRIRDSGEPAVPLEQPARGNLEAISLSVSSANMHELPCGEKSGLLFVITHPEEANGDDDKPNDG